MSNILTRPRLDGTWQGVGGFRREDLPARLGNAKPHCS